MKIVFLSFIILCIPFYGSTQVKKIETHYIYLQFKVNNTPLSIWMNEEYDMLVVYNPQDNELTETFLTQKATDELLNKNGFKSSEKNYNFKYKIINEIKSGNLDNELYKDGIPYVSIRCIDSNQKSCKVSIINVDKTWIMYTKSSYGTFIISDHTLSALFLSSINWDKLVSN